MKMILKSIVAVAIIAVLIGSTGCEEAKEIIPIPSMTATVDGVAWTSIFRLTVLFQSNGVFTITGTPDASEDVDKAIIITIKGTTTGTYELNTSLAGASAECAVVYKKTAGATSGSDSYYVAHTATVTLSEVNTTKQRISGTFSATLVPSSNPLGTPISITNGKFENLTYQLEQ